MKLSYVQHFWIWHIFWLIGRCADKYSYSKYWFRFHASIQKVTKLSMYVTFYCPFWHVHLSHQFSFQNLIKKCKKNKNLEILSSILFHSVPFIVFSHLGHTYFQLQTKGNCPAWDFKCHFFTFLLDRTQEILYFL